MTRPTPSLQLPYFERGDRYSATVDKSRMMMIDEQLHAFYSAIGDGVAYGLDFSLIGEYVFISSGAAFINGIFSQLMLERYCQYPNVGEGVFLKKQTNMISKVGNFSSSRKVVVNDASPASPPTFNAYVSDDFAFIYFNWNEASITTSYAYLIIDNIYVAQISRSDDIFQHPISEGSSISLKMQAFGRDDTPGLFSEEVLVSRPFADVIPPIPTGVAAVENNASICVVFDKSASGLIDKKIVSWRRVDVFGNEVGDEFSIEVPVSKSHFIIRDLINGFRYRVSIYNRSIYGKTSASVNKYLVPTSAAQIGDVDDIDAIILRNPLGSFYLSVSAISVDGYDPYDPMNNLYLRIHKNGNFGFVWTSKDIKMPNSGNIELYTVQAMQGSSFTTQYFEDKSTYTIVLFRKVGQSQTRGRFTRVISGDSTPPPPVVDISGFFSVGGSVRFNWAHQDPSDVSYYELSVVSYQIQERIEILNEDPSDSIYIARRYSGNMCDFNFTISGVTLRIQGVDDSNFTPVDGFSEVSFDLTDKNITDVIAFINYANIRMKSKVTGITYSMFQLIEARPAFSFWFNPALTRDGINISSPSLPAQKLAATSNARLADTSPILFRMGEFNSDITDDGTGGFFASGGIILQVKDSSASPTTYTYTTGQQIAQVSQKTKLRTYLLPSGLTKPKTKYSISIVAVDEYNNKSIASSFDLFSPFIDDMPAPGELDGVFSAVVQDGIMVTWNGKSRLPARKFLVYRSQVDSSGSLGPYGLIAEIDPSSYEYLDLMVLDGNSYSYRIGYENFWGARSMRPETYELEGKIGVLTTFVSRSENPGPTGLSSQFINDDYVLSWNEYTIPVDGFELYVSDPSTGRFSRVGSSDSKSKTYTLRNFKLANGEYRFAIRSIVSECSVVTAQITNPPDSSMLLFSRSQNGSLKDERRLLSNMIDPVVENAEELIAEHRHFRLDDNNDFRIDLSDLYLIDKYVSEDRLTYIPSSPIEVGIDPSHGVVFVNNSVTSVGYQIFGDGSINFVEELPDDSVVKSVVFGTSEVEGVLDGEQIGILSAGQLTSGTVSRGVIPSVNHDETFMDMLPMTCIMQSADNFRWFATVNERNKIRLYSESDSQYSEVAIELAGAEVDTHLGSVPSSFPISRGSARAFIHDMEFFGNIGFVASSVGSWMYKNTSDIGTIVEISSSLPPDDAGCPFRIRIFGDIVFIIAFRGIDMARIQADGNLTPLATGLGMQRGVKCFRDVIRIDDLNFIAVAANAIWKISIQLNSQIYFRQLPSISSEATLIWSCFSWNGLPYIYSEDGLFVGDSSGSEFSLLDNLPGRLKIIDTYIEQDFVLLIATNSIWRLDNSSVSKMFQSDIRLGRCAVHEDGLFVCSDDGLLRTNSDTNLRESDRYVLRKMSMPKFTDGRFFLPLTVKSHSGRLWVGGEGGAISAVNFNRWANYCDLYFGISIFDVKESPTLYINGKPRHIGIYFQFVANGSRVFPRLAADQEYESQLETGLPECVFLEEPPEEFFEIEVARSYHAWRHPKGRWAHLDYAAPIALKVNGKKINDGSRAKRPYDDIAFISSLNPTFGEESSAKKSFDLAFQEMRDHAKFMLINSENTETGEPESYGVHRFSRSNMRILLSKIERANRFVYDRQALAFLGIDATYRLPDPMIKVDLLANAFESPYGVRSSLLSSLGVVSYPFSETIVGNKGVYDAEDIGYRLPPIFPKDSPEGSLEPNYELLPEDASALSIPIEDLAFTGEFTYFGIIPSVLRFFGRRKFRGQILDGPSTVLPEIMSQ
jgi:hypothetical protein